MQSPNNTLLLFGMPRSGTTWLAKMIDSHPDVIYRHEPDSEKKIPIPLITQSNERYDEIVGEYGRGILNLRTIKTCGKAPFFNKSYFNPFTASLLVGSVYLAKLAKRVNVSIKIIEHLASDKDLCLLWKSIESVGRIETIMAGMPECKMIYIIRHPCGQIASVLNGEKSRYFSSAIQTADDFGVFERLLDTDAAKQRNLTLDQLKSCTPIQRLAYRWLLYNEHALNSLKKYADRSFVVRYEDVCEKPLDMLKDIFDFSELVWHSQVETFINNSISEDSYNYYSVYKNPRIAMNKWKEELTRQEVDDIYNIIANSLCHDYYKF
ncbi:MAG: sulfotransferase [Bacteroidetes bacterium]|nr:sulfotransferase [Bacteroidota bacterium]